MTETWNYDKTGNWLAYNKNGTVENRTHNKANEIQSTCTHDRNGNMTVMPGQKAKYDAWNRLVEVRDSLNNLLASYIYNGLNYRVKKNVGGVVTTSFYNEKWQELETQEPGVSTPGLSVYVWGLRYIDDLVLRERGAEKLYSLADPNWNVVAITDSSGIILERMKYDAFGKVTWSNANVCDWNRTFTGQVLDAETGLMLYRNRYYHTGLGRFIAREPIGYDGKDENLYRYVANRVTFYLDPFGLKAYSISLRVEDDLLSKLQQQCPRYLAELQRIYDDCMKDHGCSDDNLTVTVLGTKANPKGQKGLGKINGTPTLGFDVKQWNPPLYAGARGDTPPLGQGGGYGINLNFSEIIKKGGDCSKTVATVLAHEAQEAQLSVSLFTSKPQGNAHVGKDEYVDSERGKVDGKLSPEGCKTLLKKLGIKTK